MTVLPRMLLCLVVACIIVGVAVLPAVESCKSTCVGGGSMTPSKVWFGISALAFVGVLTVSWRQRDRKGP